MAIIDKVEVTIQVDGRNLQEYDDESDGNDESDTVNETPQVSKYIESTSGANFHIRMKIHPGFKWGISQEFIKFDTLIDGCIRDTPSLSFSDYSYSLGAERFRDGIRSQERPGSWVKHPYQFSDVTIEEQNSESHLNEQDLKKKYGKVGTINVTAKRYGNERQIEPGKDTIEQGIGAIPEKALKGKAVSHSASLKAPVTTIQPNWIVGDFLGPPIAIFEFKYRSRESLKKLVIIPRSPTPVPLEDREFDQLTDEERRIVFEKQRASLRDMRAERDVKPKFKRERPETAEPPARDHKVSRTSTGEECIEID